MMSAEGKVKPIQAAARWVARAQQAGRDAHLARPGRAELAERDQVGVARVVEPAPRCTSSARKYPRCADRTAKEVRPSRRKTARTSSQCPAGVEEAAARGARPWS